MSAITSRGLWTRQYAISWVLTDEEAMRADYFSRRRF